MRCPCFVFAGALMFAACSPARLVERYVARKFKQAGLEQHKRNIGANRIHYWDSGGDKPAIVLVHGFGANAGVQWFRQVKTLTRHYRVIMPDLLYFGGSAPLLGTAYGVADQVEMLQALLDDLNIERFALCGISYGGLVAAELARKVPHRVDKLVAVDALLKFYDDTDMRAVCLTYDVAEVEDLFAPQDYRAVGKLTKAAFLRRLPMPRFVAKDIFKSQYAENAHHLRGMILQLKADKSRYAAVDYTFPFPMCVIWGERDDIISLARGRQLADHLRANLHVIPRTKHFPNIERPRLFNRLLVRFLVGGF